MAPTTPTAGTAHHGLAAHEVVLLLGTDPHRGLTTAEATSRLDRFGPNLLPHAEAGVQRFFEARTRASTDSARSSSDSLGSLSTTESSPYIRSAMSTACSGLLIFK
jgi:hypothetical protein